MSTILSRTRLLVAIAAIAAPAYQSQPAGAQGSAQPNARPIPGFPVKAPPASGKFRFTINGFTVNSATRDHILDIDGIGDEVFVSSNVVVVDSLQGLSTPFATLEGKVYGEARLDIAGKGVWSGRVRAGSGSPKGGLRTGNSFPVSPAFKRMVAPASEYLPQEVWCGTLTDGQNAAVIVPSIWEWDGVSSTFHEWINWGSQLANTLSGQKELLGLVASASTTAAGVVGAATLGAKLALGAAVSLDSTGLVGGEADRPIGVSKSKTRLHAYDFVPQHKFVMNYRTADFSTRENAAGSVGGMGPGVYALQFVDDGFYQGRYTLYVQIERIDGKPCVHEYRPPPAKK